MEQEWLDHILEGLDLLLQRGGDGPDPDRAAEVLVYDDLQQAPIYRGQADPIYDLKGECRSADLWADVAAAFDLSVVADPAEQPVGNADGA